MEYIENSLQTYRLRKRRQEKLNQIKNYVRRLFMIAMKNGRTLNLHKFDPVEYLSHFLIGVEETDKSIDDQVLSSEEETDHKLDTATKLYLQHIIRLVYFGLWVTLYVIAIKLQFGIVFLMFSALVGIYLNTRTNGKKKNQKSAYSVFNKKCESIDGTLKAEQFELEIGIRQKDEIDIKRFKIREHS